MQFQEIVGQGALKQQLIESVNEGRIPHAQLFLGPAGSGGLTLAVGYAQYISCRDRQSKDSCGECASCKKYQKLIHPDLHFSYPFFAKSSSDTALTFIEQWREAFLSNSYLDLNEWRTYVDAGNKQANINIAECHQIIQKLSLKPFESEYKVLIMWLPEYLDKEGNALLKMIEEPPQKTLFLLVAHQQEQILTTILSRTQLVKIPALKNEDISRFLIEKHQVSKEQADMAAYLSEGNLQAAFQILENEQSNHFEMLAFLLRTSYAKGVMQLIDRVEDFSKAGRENQKNFIAYAIQMLREVILYLNGLSQLVKLPANELNFIQKFSKVMDLHKAEALIAELEKAHYHIERNANPKILFLDVSLKFIKIFHS